MSTTKRHVLTEDELAALNAAERAQQGFAPYVTDPTAIAVTAIQAANALRARAAAAVSTNGKVA